MTEISLIFQAIRTTFITRKSRQLRPDEDTIPEGTIHILRKHIFCVFLDLTPVCVALPQSHYKEVPRYTEVRVPVYLRDLLLS